MQFRSTELSPISKIEQIDVYLPEHMGFQRYNPTAAGDVHFTLRTVGIVRMSIRQASLDTCIHMMTSRSDIMVDPNACARCEVIRSAVS
jgi:hypothetical protein